MEYKVERIMTLKSCYVKYNGIEINNLVIKSIKSLRAQMYIWV